MSRKTITVLAAFVVCYVLCLPVLAQLEAVSREVPNYPGTGRSDETILGSSEEVDARYRMPLEGEPDSPPPNRVDLNIYDFPSTGDNPRVEGRPGCRRTLYVSISPLMVADRAPRLAEVHWDFTNCTRKVHRIALRTGNHRIRHLSEFTPVWSSLLTSRKGRLLSNYSVPLVLPEGWKKGPAPRPRPLGEFCLDLQVVLLDPGDYVVKTKCLKINPTWMALMLSFSRDNLILSEMMLPGTHNSASYSRDGNNVDNHMERYLLTQGLSVWEQLVFGVRYFDLRVGYYPQDVGDQENDTHPDHGHKFWINHDMVRVQPLKPILDDIYEFLLSAPHEVVVLDFHRFPVGFGSSEDNVLVERQRHGELFSLVENVFGNWIAPNDPFHHRSTLRELVLYRHRVILSYGNRWFQAKNRAKIWGSIPQQWGNQQTLEGLIQYLDAKIETKARPGELYALMAELTPTMFDVLLNMQRSSLRNMADRVNWNVTEKARSGLWYKYANIIAVDFIESTDLINIAVATNWKRSAAKRRQRRTERASHPVQCLLQDDWAA